ncbi:hypothetical protein TYRP_013243 [Tyrophagus putrescentiae]|nr:hypothetical protein TYRP_013243 [Tyrophagus putrescentiae]
MNPTRVVGALLLLFSCLVIAGNGTKSCNNSASMQSDYEKCLKEAYAIAGLPTNDTSAGEQAIDALIIAGSEKKDVGCKAKWNFTFCLVESACWECDQMEEAQANGGEGAACTEAHWKDDQEKKKHQTTVTTITTTTDSNSSSTPSSANKIAAIGWATVFIAVIGSVVAVHFGGSAF